MEVTLIKDFQYYLDRPDGKGKRLFKSKKGTKVDVDKETSDRWLSKKVISK